MRPSESRASMDEAGAQSGFGSSTRGTSEHSMSEISENHDPGPWEALEKHLGRPSLFLSLLGLSTLVLYSGALSFDFVWDDWPQIINNPIIRSWHNLPRVFGSDLWYHVARHQVYYRPLFVAWSMLNYALFGSKPWGWHLGAILVHIAATASVFWLARKLTLEYWTAALAAVIFRTASDPYRSGGLDFGCFRRDGNAVLRLSVCGVSKRKDSGPKGEAILVDGLLGAAGLCAIHQGNGSYIRGAGGNLRLAASGEREVVGGRESVRSRLGSDSIRTCHWGLCSRAHARPGASDGEVRSEAWHYRPFPHAPSHRKFLCQTTVIPSRTYRTVLHPICDQPGYS